MHCGKLSLWVLKVLKVAVKAMLLTQFQNKRFVLVVVVHKHELVMYKKPHSKT